MEIPSKDATILTDRKIIPRSLFILIGAGICVMVALTFGFLYFVQLETSVVSEVTEPEVSEIVATSSDEYKNDAAYFVFEIVPDATSSITLAPPTPYSQADIAAYKTASQKSTNDTLAVWATSSVFSEVTPQGKLIATFVSSDEQTDRFTELYDELIELTVFFNQKYTQQPLYEFSSEVVPVGAPTLLTPLTYLLAVYPNARSVEAFLMAYYMSHYYPNDAVYYNNLAEAYSKQGIALGWYNSDSIQASKRLVEQYFAQVPATIFDQGTLSNQ